MKKDFTKEKIVTVPKLARLAKEYRRQGKRVGCMSGSFDVFTARHFKSLYECAKSCDVLIVLLNSDVSVRGYKGPGKPIMAETERSYLLAQSPYVSHITIFDDLTPLNVLEQVRPDIFFNTAEWGSDCIERGVVEKHGGRVSAFDITLEEGWMTSTSALIKKIISSESAHVRRAVFLDRDGVINDNKEGYIYKWSDFEFLPNVLTVLKKLQKADFLLFIVTNQSGIGRGYYTEQDVQKLHRKVKAHLREHGITITEIYHCPHHPDDHCDCRKPAPGMLLKASVEHGINLSKSWFIGDSGSDVDAGRQANVHTILIDSHMAKEKPGQFKPTVTVSNITEAAAIIIAKK